MQPTITADRRWLHLEARYNYEDLDTASVWVGYNFSVGEKLSLDITPMLGGVFGNTTGIAPGLRGSLKWWRLELYGEARVRFQHARKRRLLFLHVVGVDGVSDALAFMNFNIFISFAACPSRSCAPNLINMSWVIIP